MYHFLWLIMAAVSTPAVTAGPDLAEQAVVVDSPISQVTVYSDRAKVRRVAKVSVKQGISTLRLSDLPGAVIMNSIRVECSGAKVLRVESVPIERERLSIEQVDGLLEKLEALMDKLDAVDLKRKLFIMELSVLNGIKPALAVPEAKRVGKKEPPIEPDMWLKVLDFIQKRTLSVMAKARALDDQRRDIVEELQKVRREVNRFNTGAFSDRKVQVLAIIQSGKTKNLSIALEYFIPGASWKPIYDLTYESRNQKVILRSAGRVTQATGEDWSDVKLLLSTAIPGQGIDIPQLLTWTLGEKKEFVPHARAARMPRTPNLFPPPTPSKTPYEAKRQARLDVLRNRLNSVQNLLAKADRRASGADEGITLDGWTEGGKGIGSLSIPGKGYAGYGGLNQDSTGAYAEKKAERARPMRGSRMKYKKMARRPSAPLPPPMASPEPSIQYDEAPVDSDHVSLQSASTSSRTQRVALTSLALFEPNRSFVPHFSDSTLPAVVAGGLDYVYKCPSTMTIPSTGEQISVPLSLKTYPAKVLYEATPSLKKTAYLKAEVENRGSTPILAGDVNIFMGPDFVSQGRLNTTGPGGMLALPLGADEDIRLKRTVVPSTRTEGVFSKDDVTDYTVTIEVGNYKKRSIRLAVYDQIPKTNNKEIEIESLKIYPKPVMKPNHDGIMEWILKIPAGQTRKIKFSYRIKRPENWQLYQVGG